MLVTIISYLPWQKDLTDNRRYTLSEPSKAILERIEEPVEIQFYYSRSVSDLPPRLRNFAERIEMLLRQYERQGRERLIVQVIDPRPDTQEEEEALRSGLQGFPLPTGERAFLGMVVRQADTEEIIPFFDPARENLIEYRISTAIDRVQRIEKPKLGLLTSLPILSGEEPPPWAQQQEGSQNGTPWAFADSLREYFEVEEISGEAHRLPADLDALAVIHPPELSENLAFAVDQFLLQGSPVFLAVDPSSQYAQRSFTGVPSQSNPTKLLDGWGIDFDEDQVTGDRLHPTQIDDGRGQVFSIPIWPTIGRNHLNRDHPLTSDLENLLLVEPGHFTVRAGRDLNLTPLITLGEGSGFIHRTLIDHQNPARTSNRFIRTDNDKILAGIIQGSFRSAFPDGPPALGENPDEEEPWSEWLLRSENEGLLILVADSDWIADDFSLQRLRFMGRSEIRPFNDNFFLGANIVEFLSGSRSLMGLRGRAAEDRSFEVVQRLQAESMERYQAELTRLEERLQEVQNNLQEIQQKRGEAGGRLALTPEQQEAILEFQEEEATVRGQLREIRQALREDIESLKRTLFVINLTVSPILISLLGAMYYMKRRRKLTTPK